MLKTLNLYQQKAQFFLTVGFILCQILTTQYGVLQSGYFLTAAQLKDNSTSALEYRP